MNCRWVVATTFGNTVLGPCEEREARETAEIGVCVEMMMEGLRSTRVAMWPEELGITEDRRRGLFRLFTVRCELFSRVPHHLLN